MKKDRTKDELEFFYAELPQADYLSDLSDIEIQDAYDHEEGSPGLRKEDVHKLRDDILQQPSSKLHSTQENLQGHNQNPPVDARNQD